MNKVIKKIVESPYTPEDKNVYWDNNDTIMKYKEGQWVPVTAQSLIPTIELNVKNPHSVNMSILQKALKNYGSNICMFKIIEINGNSYIGFGHLNPYEIIITTLPLNYEMYRYSIRIDRDWDLDQLRRFDGIDFRGSDLYGG